MTTEKFTHCFADPLRSNRMLSSSEEAVTRISYWETDSSISRLDAQIKDLLLRRHALCNHRQMLATLLSPVRRLPPELLGEIFRYCLPQDYHEKGAHKAVMLPSHVCKGWRDVALSTPTLWTNIVLHVTDETFMSRVALVTAWVSRSGGLPLSFTLEGRENARPILSFLLQYCNRWQYIHLSIPSDMLRCLEAAKGNLQCLETMWLDGFASNTSYSVEHIFELAPRLWKVSFSSRLVCNGPSGSWAQLTELDASCVSYTVGDCLALLQSIRSLQKLRVYIGSEVVEGHHRLVFSHPLASLDVMGETTQWMFFDYVTLPNLRHLSVNDRDSDWPQFISFLARSSPPLQSFSLRTPEEVNDVWDDYIIQILQHIPTLHSLCIVVTWCEFGACSFLRRLSPRILGNGQVECLIPKLNAISIHLDCQFGDPDYEALKEMVLSRCSLAHNTEAGTISGPIKQIQKVEVECIYEEEWYKDDVTWHKEVSEILAPLQEVVDTVEVIIYQYAHLYNI